MIVREERILRIFIFFLSQQEEKETEAEEEETENFGQIFCFWSSFFLPHKRQTPKKRDRIFFQNRELHYSFTHLHHHSLVVLFCGVFLPRSEDHGESFCERCFLKTEREKERERV